MAFGSRNIRATAARRPTPAIDPNDVIQQITTGGACVRTSLCSVPDRV